MFELLTRTFPEFIYKLCTDKFAPREAWTIADYVIVGIVVLPYLAGLAIMALLWTWLA